MLKTEPTITIFVRDLIKTLLESSTHEIVVILDKELKFLALNPASKQELYTLYGKPVEVGMRLVDILAEVPDDQIKEVALWQRALNGEEFEITEEFGNPTRERHSFEMHFYPLKDENNNIIGATHLAHNVTLRLQAEREQQQQLTQAVQERCQSIELAKENADRYLTLIEAAHCIVWNSDAEGNFTHRQTPWEKCTGLVWPDYQGQEWLKAIQDDDRGLLLNTWQESIQQQKLFDITIRIWSKHYNEYRFNLFRAVPFFASDTNLKEWIGTCLDIHNLKQNEEKLRTATESLSLALRSAQMGTWYWDLKTNQITWDDHMYHLFGLKKGEFEANYYEDSMKLIYPEDKEQLENNLLRCINELIPYEAEFRVMWQDKSIHTLISRGEAYTGNQRNAIKMVGVTWDITQRKQLEAERETLRKAREQEEKRAKESETFKHKQADFIDAVCHEVRAPLTGLYGCADTYQMEIAKLSRLLEQESNQLPLALKQTLSWVIQQLKDTTETLDSCVKQQKVILDDVLDLSKLEANKIELNLIPFDLKQTLHLVIKMFKQQLQQKNLKLFTHIPEKELLYKGDPHRLSQVLINLLANAIKFTPAGSITLMLEIISATNQQTTVSFNVKDTGIGMTEEEQQNLFDRFAQASKRIASEYGGSGLGLVISRQLVELMGGHLIFKSQKWHGTEFHFNVAYQNLKPQERYNLLYPISLSANSQLIIPNKTILIAEDNLINQKVIKNYIEQQGHTCLIANNGEEAVQIFKNKPIDLIFMDLHMPIKDGYAATQEIRAIEQDIPNQRHVPIIGLSGNAGIEYKRQALAIGMDDYLTKPYTKPLIYEKIVGFTMGELLAQPPTKSQKLSHNSSSSPKRKTFLDITEFFSAPVAPSTSNYKTAVDQFKQTIRPFIENRYPFLVIKSDNVIRIQVNNELMNQSPEQNQLILQELKQHLEKVCDLLQLNTPVIEEQTLILTADNVAYLESLQGFFHEVGLSQFMHFSTEAVTTKHQPSKRAHI